MYAQSYLMYSGTPKALARVGVIVLCCFHSATRWAFGITFPYHSIHFTPLSAHNDDMYCSPRICVTSIINLAPQASCILLLQLTFPIISASTCRNARNFGLPERISKCFTQFLRVILPVWSSLCITSLSRNPPASGAHSCVVLGAAEAKF